MDSINPWSMPTDKVLENRLRRWAEGLGFALHRDRARTWSVDHQLQYQLTNAYTGAPVLGPRFDASLDAVEAFLEPAERTRQEQRAARLKAFREYNAAFLGRPSPSPTEPPRQSFEDYLKEYLDSQGWPSSPLLSKSMESPTPFSDFPETAEGPKTRKI